MFNAATTSFWHTANLSQCVPHQTDVEVTLQGLNASDPGSGEGGLTATGWALYTRPVILDHLPETADAERVMTQQEFRGSLLVVEAFQTDVTAEQVARGTLRHRGRLRAYTASAPTRTLCLTGRHDDVAPRDLQSPSTNKTKQKYNRHFVD